MAFKHACSMCSLACLAGLACSARQPASPACTVDLRKTLWWWLLLSFWGSQERHRRCDTREKNSLPFFWERRQNRQKALRDFTCGLLVATIDEAYQWPTVKAAIRCLLLTKNEADNKHHALAKSLSMFETSTQKTNGRHPTPFPNTNEVECMPATSLHDLLDSMHNTLSHLQIAAGRACDVIYSLIRVSSPWPVFIKQIHKYTSSMLF